MEPKILERPTLSSTFAAKINSPGHSGVRTTAPRESKHRSKHLVSEFLQRHQIEPKMTKQKSSPVMHPMLKHQPKAD